MRAALVLAALVSVSGGIAATAVGTGHTPATTPRTGSAAQPLRVPQRLAQALVRRGYPVRHPCGSVAEPPPRSSTHGGLIQLKSVPACWLVIYKDGYSVSITPHSTRAAAKVAYERTHNKWARQNRSVAVGRLLVSGFRVPEHEWNVIRGIVLDVTSSRH